MQNQRPTAHPLHGLQEHLQQKLQHERPCKDPSRWTVCMVQVINIEKTQNGKRKGLIKLEVYFKFFLCIIMCYNSRSVPDSTTPPCAELLGETMQFHYQYRSIELAAVFSIDNMLFLDNECFFSSHSYMYLSVYLISLRIFLLPALGTRYLCW